MNNVEWGRNDRSLEKTPEVREIVLETAEMWSFQVNLSSMVTPRNLVECTWVIGLLSIKNGIAVLLVSGGLGEAHEV